MSTGFAATRPARRIGAAETFMMTDGMLQWNLCKYSQLELEVVIRLRNGEMFPVNSVYIDLGHILSFGEDQSLGRICRRLLASSYYVCGVYSDSFTLLHINNPFIRGDAISTTGAWCCRSKGGRNNPRRANMRGAGVALRGTYSDML